VTISGLVAVLVWGLSTPLSLAQSVTAVPSVTPASGDAQTPTASPDPQPTTREGQIELARRQKDATLWPERENPLVVKANRLLDRGLIEGIQTGQGNNGWQLLFEGTRPAQGQTVGIGYRRSDLFNDALSARGTVRGTLRGAFLVDGELQVNRLRRSEDTFVDVYMKYERSPIMDYYGLGANSRKEDHTRYELNTASIDARAGYRFTRALNAGVDLGLGAAHTGPTSGDDVPSIETRFDRTTAPGLFDDTTFTSWGAFAGFDTRDQPRGPRRGGFYGIEFDRYLDIDSGAYTHRQLSLEGQQFFPYFNKQRVVALFARARFAYTGRDDRVVPFYLLPQLGGSFELRGFDDYRFADNNAFVAAIEHRWYAFSGLEMALFIDAGQTVPEKGGVNLSSLKYSGGGGMRVRLGGAVVLRMDVAHSREGTRWIWSMSDISRRRF
jgi:outer membrane protein assembly factor BamA